MRELPEGWVKTTLGENISDIAMGPFGSNLKVDSFIDAGVPVIKGGNLAEYYVCGDFSYVSEEKADSLKRSVAYSGDIIITHRGTLGQVSLVPVGYYPRYVTSQSQLRFTPDDEKIDAKYLLYFLKSRIGQYELLMNSSQVGVPAIATPTKTVKSINLLLPSLPEQKAIANILSSFDEKIEILRAQNETLETLAQTIFKEWFVNFNYPGATGEMVDSELGEIPKGWRVGKLKDVVNIFDSKRIPLSSNERQGRQGTYPYYGATKAMDYIDDYLFDGTYLLMAEDGSVMDDKGYPFLQYVWGKFWVNNHTHVLQGKNNFSTAALYVFLKRRRVASIVNGAVQLKINQTNLMNFEMLLPAADVIKKFNALLHPIFEKIKNNTSQIQTLTKTRDTLLPKLMSGEIRVSS